MRSTKQSVLFSLLAVVCFVAIQSRTASAAVISYPSTNIPIGSSEPVTINVIGTDQVAGLNFRVQIGDGGSNNGGTTTKPPIVDEDILTGTIFAMGNTGQSKQFASPPLYAVDATTLSSGTVQAQGKLATVTLDTSGLTPGQTFSLTLSGVGPNSGNTALLDAQGAAVPLTGTGPVTFTVTPEPASAFGLLIVAGVTMARRRRTAVA